MKRLATILILALAATLITAVPAAQAEQRRTFRCDHRSWTSYLGLESPVFHYRWARLNTSMRACWDKSNGLVLHKKTNVSMSISPNGFSESWGTHWTVEGPWQASYSDGLHQNYSDKRYFMGTFRNCQGVGSLRVCGPTGHFQITLTFNAPRLIAWEGGSRWEQHRRAGAPHQNPDNFDKKIRFYNTP